MKKSQELSVDLHFDLRCFKFSKQFQVPEGLSVCWLQDNQGENTHFHLLVEEKVLRLAADPEQIQKNCIQIALNIQQWFINSLLSMILFHCAT